MKIFNYSKYNFSSWDNQILNSIVQIHEYKVKLQSIEEKNLFKTKKMMETARFESTEIGNKFDAIVTNEARLRNILENKYLPKNEEEKQILGYHDILKILYGSNRSLVFDSNYILQLHRGLYRYTNNTMCGKFKNNQNYIVEPSIEGTSSICFYPLSVFETPSAIKSLCEEFNLLLNRHSVDTLLLIPIFILDFLCIYPFNEGNARIIFLLINLLLNKFGYTIVKYSSFEKIVEETKSEFFNSFRASSYGWHEDSNDVLPFIKYFLSILLKIYRDLDERLYAMKKVKITAKEQILEAIEIQYGQFTKRDIIKLCPHLSESTIEKVLKELLDIKKITKFGDRKSTYYTRNE